MSDYTFKNIEDLVKSEGYSDVLNTGIHVILFNPTAPPPHLLILVHGEVFSLSVSGPRVNWPLQDLLTMVESRKIPTLLISLRDPDSLVIKDTNVKEVIHDLTVIHPDVRTNEASCLFPIMEFCKTVYNIDISKVKVIFDLLDQLEAKNVIESLWQVNMSKWISDGEFRITRYGVEEVNEMITNLKN